MRDAFGAKHATSQKLSKSSVTDIGKKEPREVLRFTRAEVNEEVLQGKDYGRTKTRANFHISVKFESGTFAGALHHFLRIPHPNDKPDEPNQRKAPLKLAMVGFYEPLYDNNQGSRKRQRRATTGGQQEGNTGVLRVNARVMIKGEDYLAVDPLAIVNKHVVAHVGGPGHATELQFMTYAGLTGTR